MDVSLVSRLCKPRNIGCKGQFVYCGINKKRHGSISCIRFDKCSGFNQVFINGNIVMKTVKLDIKARKQGLISLIQLMSPEVSKALEGELETISVDELYEIYLKLR